MDQTRPHELVTLNEARRRTGIGRRQLRRAAARGELPVFQIGSWCRVRWVDVLERIKSRRKRTSPIRFQVGRDEESQMPEVLTTASDRAKWVRVYGRDVLRAPISDAGILAGVRLASWLMERSARDMLDAQRSCQATLNDATLHQITGKKWRSKQLEVLGEFAEYAGVAIEDFGEFVRIGWPKFLDHLPPAARRSGQRRADADSDSDADSDADADSESDAHADASDGFEERIFEESDAKKNFAPLKGLAETSDPPVGGHSTDEPIQRLFEKVIRDHWPGIGEFELRTAADEASSLHVRSEANLTTVGARPWILGNWEEVPSLRRIGPPQDA